MGEKRNQPFQLSFNASLKVEAESGVTSPVMVRIIDRWGGPDGPRFKITFGGTRQLYNGCCFGSQKGNSG